MTQLIDRDESSPSTMAATMAQDASPAALLTRTFRHLAAQDVLIFAYLSTLFAAVYAGQGEARSACLTKVAVDISCFCAGLLLTRGGILRQGSFANGIVYRFTVFLSVFLSYFQLRDILPVVTTRAYDAQILAFDMRVFGFEPSVAWDRFVTPATTEWFAFFYFGYFFILSAHVLPMMLNAGDARRLAHFSLGVFLVFCTAHSVYMLVPGWGPYRHLSGQFEHELSGGLFWGLVKATVEAGGAQKDIFPSLHTAAPTYFALFSFRYRQRFPFRFTWPLMFFIVSQIIGATMFLRWHYLIDIVAGLTLASSALWISGKITDWEWARREREGLSPVFTLLDYPWTKRDESRRAC